MEKNIFKQPESRTGQDGSLIAMMQQLQQEYGYLPEPVLREMARATGAPLIEIYRVATFYKSFSFAPRGEHLVTTCSGTACHVRGGAGVTREISKLLGVKPGCTSKDGRFTLETVNCLGACALAPLVVFDGEYHGNMTPANACRLFKNYTAGDAEA